MNGRRRPRSATQPQTMTFKQYSAHKHDWQEREKTDRQGRTIKGFVCSCGAVEYTDLV